jgi:hypothetical protein
MWIKPNLSGIVVGFLLLLSCRPALATVVVEYFYQPGCRECELIDVHVKPVLAERFPGHCELREYDIGITENFLRLAAYQDRWQLHDNEPVCMVVDGAYPFNGYRQISEGLLDRIDLSLAQGAPPVPLPEAAAATPSVDDGLLRRRAASFTVAAVAAAGLADGINPCVFSTLVFLFSLLAVSGVRGRKLLLVGAVYCLACFLSYLALGIGLYRWLKLLDGHLVLQSAINAGLAALLVGLAALSFLDAWRFHRTCSPASVTLQLPERIKERIHRAMKAGLRHNRLLPAVFVLGVLVTALESVCTGQVYVPTLALLARSEGPASRGFALLLLYNLMFILPLAVLLVLVWRGLGTPRLLAWSRRHVVPAKILLGLLFLALAIVMFMY